MPSLTRVEAERRASLLEGGNTGKMLVRIER